MKTFLSILLTLLSFNSYAQKSGQLLIDSLHSALKQVQPDTSKVNLLTQLSYTYMYINTDSGLICGNQALELAKKIDWPRGIATSNASIGSNYRIKSNYNKALEHLDKALEIYTRLQQKRSIAAVHQNIALVYHAQSNYALALENNLKAANIFESIDDKRSVSITYENIGSLYLEQKDYDKTIHYYKEAIEINQAIGNMEGIARNKGNIGIVFNRLGNNDKALEYHLSALNINKTLGSPETIQINLANVGLAYYGLQQFDKALRYSLEALKISEEIGNKNGIAINLGNIGEIYYSLAKEQVAPGNTNHSVTVKANLKKAIDYLGRAINMCKEIGFLGPLTEFMPYLSEAYNMQGDSKKAYEYYKEYVTIKDSVFSLESMTQMAGLENKWKEDLHKKDAELKEKQIRLAELEIKQKKNQQVVFLLGIFLLLFSLGMAVKSIRTYQRKNRLLKKEKTTQDAIIVTQDKDIQLRNKVLEEIAEMQSHDIRGHVATLLGLAQLFNEADAADPINKTVVEGMNKSAQKLDEVIKEVVKKENELNKGDEG